MIHLGIIAVTGNLVGECISIRGVRIGQGEWYEPDADLCKSCACDNGQPKNCKAVLCSPPPNCKSFKMGANCCDLVCQDNIEKIEKNTDFPI